MTERNAPGTRPGTVSRRKLVDRALQLQQANEQMTDFIAMLTHDVRQPLTGVIARGELLIDEWPDLTDNERMTSVRQMTVSGHRADHLVGEILTLAQLDAGAMIARLRRVDLSHAVHEAVAAQDPGAGRSITVLAPEQVAAFARPGPSAAHPGQPDRQRSQVRCPAGRHHARETGPAYTEIQIADHGEGRTRGVRAAPVRPVHARRLRRRRQQTRTPESASTWSVSSPTPAASPCFTGPRDPHGSIFVLTVPHASHPNADKAVLRPGQQARTDGSAAIGPALNPSHVITQSPTRPESGHSTRAGDGSNAAEKV